jgi:hypothetical protein
MTRGCPRAGGCQSIWIRLLTKVSSRAVTLVIRQLRLMPQYSADEIPSTTVLYVTPAAVITAAGVV